jgi:hypothetical protein
MPCAAADLFALETGVKVMCSNQPIEVLDVSVPEAVDWNNDGKVDLLVSGLEKHGGGPPVRLYLNEAATADAPPVFDRWSLVGIFPLRWG